MGLSEDAAHEMRAVALLDALSSKSLLAPSKDWPRSLQDIVGFLMKLSHPAAIFIGQELVIIHNDAWKDNLGGDLEQGRPQYEVLSEQVVKALHSAIDGKLSCSLTTRDFIARTKSNTVHCPVLCSQFICEQYRGVIVQVVYQQSDQPDVASEHDSALHCCSIQGEVSNPDIEEGELSLDKQPFFQKFAEMLPTGLAILDHNAQAIFVNQHFHNLTAHENSEQHEFSQWPQTIHPEDYDRVMTAYREAFEARSDLSTEFRAYGANNPWRLFLMKPLGDANLQQSTLRKYGGFICAVVDISSLKAAELSQKKAAREAQERKKQQERFIDMISHEIRNPLSAVLHCAEDIQESIQYGNARPGDLSLADIVESCDTIALCVSHQKTLIDDVLNFSKLDASMLALVPRSTSPRVQMSEALKIFQPELRKQHIEFEYKVDPTYVQHSIEWVMADLVRISQVLVNLMTNAIKFTAKKDGSKKISVAVGASVERPTSYPPNVVFFESEDQEHLMDSTQSTQWGNGQALYILVAIKDNGIGISRKNQEKLFDRFRQATPKTEEIYGGSGLGLNISRKLCQLHGGEIGVSSKEGSGSTFGFFYRVRRSDSPPPERQSMKPCELRQSLQVPESVGRGPKSDKDHPDTLQSPPVAATTDDDQRWEHTAQIAADMRRESSSQDASKVRMEADIRKPKPKVLFVEDNLINQKLLKRKMEGKGFEVVTANNGQEAVQAFKRASESVSDAFDCVLMDQEMPIMDGNAASRALRAYEREESLAPTHIVGVTANVRDEQQQEMKDAGMDSVLSKPFKIEELVHRVHKVVGNPKPKE